MATQESLERALAAIKPQLVVKTNPQGEHFVSLLDSEGNHLFSAPSWGWYEGTVQHRDEMVKRIAEIFVPVLDAVALAAGNEALEKAAVLVETKYFTSLFNKDEVAAAIRAMKGEG